MKLRQTGGRPNAHRPLTRFIAVEAGLCTFRWKGKYRRWSYGGPPKGSPTCAWAANTRSRGHLRSARREPRLGLVKL